MKKWICIIQRAVTREEFFEATVEAETQEQASALAEEIALEANDSCDEFLLDGETINMQDFYVATVFDAASVPEKSGDTISLCFGKAALEELHRLVPAESSLHGMIKEAFECLNRP